MVKIAVYAIALNEERHVKRWAESISEADYIVVADTGSTDSTVELLKSRGITVYNISVSPWRYDTARNSALSLIPIDADVCISLDLDEWLEPGWRAAIEAAWLPQTTRLNYRYCFNYSEMVPNNYFWIDKIHSRHGYRWQRPVHETIFPENISEFIVSTSDLIMNQIQDTTKSSRNNYLSLLRQSHTENPQDSQTLFWLARELLSKGIRDEAYTTFIKYLDLPTSSWFIERSSAMIYLSQISDTRSWLFKALLESESRREIWNALASYYYNQSDWNNCVWACINGLSKSVRHGSYLDDNSAWGNQLHDFAAIAYYNLGDYSRAKSHCDSALAYSPSDSRLLQNGQFIISKLG